MIAKFPTSCGVCSSAISPGEEISRVGERWSHHHCVGRTAAPDDASSPAELGPLPTGSESDSELVSGSDSGALEVWTDGACSGNPGPGGWAWATRDGRQGSGPAAATTNQRMEIQAALEAVRALSGPLIVVSDSTYVVNCFRDGWWKGWLARGWTNSAKKPVANRDLWEPLITMVRDRGDITFRWVKGHSGDSMNDLVDRLAVAAANPTVKRKG